MTDDKKEQKDDNTEEDVPQQVVIIDNGSALMKAGVPAQETPHICPTMIGACKADKSIHIGRKALNKHMRNECSLQYPMENGIIKHWAEMELIWHHIFYDQLHIEPEQHSILHTESPFNPKPNRERLTQIMFETFSVPAMYLSLGPILAMYACNRTTGCILSSGAATTHCCPIYEGYAVRHAIGRYNVAGHDITEYLMKLLNDHDQKHKQLVGDFRIARGIKEKLAFVNASGDDALDDFLDIDNDECNDAQHVYELPDASKISIGSELHRCTEILFDPQYIGFAMDGVDKTLYHAIMQCDSEIRKQMFSNIILSGGNTLFKGIEMRLCTELKKSAPSYMHIDVSAPKKRQFLDFTGGQIVSSLSTFDEMCISKSEYQETGQAIVHRKCF